METRLPALASQVTGINWSFLLCSGHDHGRDAEAGLDRLAEELAVPDLRELAASVTLAKAP